MRIGVTLSPTGDWNAILHAARLADEAGLDAVGFWDHYHSERPEWSYVCGWSATQRSHLLPMVICRLNYTLGVLAKETSILSIVSGGRFELGIGAGDYPVEYTAWHQPFPDATTRIETLAETIDALRRIWQGELVSYSGKHVQLTDAGCTPAPPLPPRVMVGVGSSRRLIRSAAAYADELNLYADPELLPFARQALAEAGRSASLSIFFHPNPWPDNLRDELARWAERGVDRVLVNIGYDMDLSWHVAELAEITLA
jgi:alkanesulfonate monooxygenase SsuD/methylene tetrahydromethanopterin reductase-like flavin-dependent oxidoreductase (luciferase family)